MEEESTQQSRLFVILAIALIGLLVLGLLGIGGVFVIRQNLQEQANLGRPTPTLTIRLPTAVVTATPAQIPPTSTPLPTPTNTPVVVPGSINADTAAVSGVENNDQGVKGLPLPKSNPPQAAQIPATVPETGLGAFEAILIALGLVGVLFVARRLRMSTQ